jgi:hypothetical protein
MPNWPAMIDENRVRLRASCNACNESKVRCSQRKPTCTRCERNEIECIYGLSRRTHKDAPPILIPPSQRGRRHSRPGRPPRLPTSGDTRTSTNSNGTSKTATRSHGCAIPDEPAETHNHNADLLNDYMFPTPTATETDSMHGAAQLLDFSSLVTGSTSSTSSMAIAPGYFSATDLTPWDLESLFGANHNGDAIDLGTGECTCHAGVTELLASMRGAGSSNGQRLSLDAQLARLKQCIVSSETSMGCTHGREDSEPIYIMAVAMLIGYVIDDFKMLASESSLRRSSLLSSSAVVAAERATLGNAERRSKSGSATPSSTNMSLGGLTEPRLSWGVLELEEDDEMDLRQRLYLLSFHKLERLLSQLTLYLRDLHNELASLPDPSRHMAFVIACDYTRLWLEQKAGDVKRLFLVPTRDDIMDSALA